MKPPKASDSGNSNVDAESADLIRRHLRFGWWTLLVFLTMGIVLEALHGFKVSWYLNVSTEPRRTLLTLGHAHGTLLALVNLAFAATVGAARDWSGRGRRAATQCLLGSTLLMPAGFILGGTFIHGSDPGLGILLVPAGALLLFLAVLLTALGLRPRR